MFNRYLEWEFLELHPILVDGMHYLRQFNSLKWGSFLTANFRPARKGSRPFWYMKEMSPE